MELGIDKLYVNNMPFLTAISKHIMHQKETWIPTREIFSYRSEIETILTIYKAAGFHVNQISCVHEFKPVLDQMKTQFNFTPNYASAQEHLSQAERNNSRIC